MKLKLLSFGAILVAGCAYGQTTEATATTAEEVVSYNALGQKVITTTAFHFEVTAPVTTWGHDEDAEVPFEERLKVRNDFAREGYDENQTEVVEYKNLQDEQGDRSLRAPLINFNGQSGSGLPPDPSGAADDTYYVQAVNTSVRVWEKDGSVVPGGTFSLSSLWPGSSNMGDPIVMYDRHADRWFISQFQQSPNRILIAISETDDPTGAYYSYSFTMSNFPDYPKYSIWWDGYYMTSNSNHTAVVFDRDKMLAGDASAQAVILSLPSLGSAGFRSPLSADADGDLPPDGTPCYFFNLEDNAFTGVSQDQIEIYEMTTDWANTSNTQVASSQILPVDGFDSMFSGGWSNIAQPGTSQGLDAIMGVFMYRAQHMRWVGYNSMMLSHAVDLGGNRSGIRWYELRDANDGNWSVHQSGTFAPDNTASRWMSSMAMDSWGNIGMAYSIADASNNVYPGLAYTGRLGGDNLGDMTFGEQFAVTGGGSQTIADRYGDYAHLSLDPDGTTFWYTGEYLAGSNSIRTRVFSFSIFDEAGVDAISPYYQNLSMIAFQNGTNLNVAVEGIYNDEKVELNIIDMGGKIVYTSGSLQPAQSELNQTINISDLESGVYFVRVGNKNFQEVERMFIKN
ncbi:MAG: T9SS type A sorting domain-containing protein [Crocinitomicaceae bacterium]|nr:T9SS type A sorting domain-containing protein [Crocinitomicaceae bacterium]